ncbi:S8 family serine peptidase [Citrobacter sp. FDAARGOS_156]|uniref:S8 family peptidase n=1 Tax=Citrobacter sp. FDAARGOS_156 TaxID=1702170 RepID=UPI0019008A44|nr:S8 family serine peptidase [Citrobacter sp. FDAARGOS_156]MBJ9111149.1 S8 family serine peptidase [Citrobacter sp. FDAARGOS_156]
MQQLNQKVVNLQPLVLTTEILQRRKGFDITMANYLILKKKPSLNNNIYTSSRNLSSHNLQLDHISLSTESLDEKDISDFIKDPDIEMIAPEMPVSLIKPFSSDKAETDTHSNWGLDAIKVNDSQYTGKGVKVAILDTGIEKSHSAFSGTKITEKDFTAEGNGDSNGHGTHCAGTIFGRDVNGVRIGIAQGIECAFIAKVLGENGSGASDSLFKAMLWALECKSDIISMSLGFDFPGMVKYKVDNGWPVELATSTALESYRDNLRMFDSLIKLSRSHAGFGYHPLFVAASGNESRRDDDIKFKISTSLPACAEGVISVAAACKVAIEHYDIASFSNVNVSLSAPGVDIISAWPGNTLKTLDGTSMACPHVAGVAALWWEERRQQRVTPTAKNVTSQLYATARRNFLSSTTEYDYGQGLVTAP